MGAGSDRLHLGAPCCGSLCSLLAHTGFVGLRTKKQSRRANCKEKNGDISQFGVEKIRAVFHAKERVKIRNSKNPIFLSSTGHGRSSRKVANLG